MSLATLLLKIPRNNDVTPEAAKTFLSTLTQINSVSRLNRLLGKKPLPFSLEIALINQQIKFFVTCDEKLVPFVEAQIKSSYPLVIIEKHADPISDIENLITSSLSLKKGNYYPIATYKNFEDVDPLSSLLTILSKGDPNEFAIIQYAISGAGSGWQSSGKIFAEQGGGKNEEGKYLVHPDSSIIKEKISYPGFYTSIRLASNSKKTLTELTSAFGVFARSDGNSFVTRGKSILSSPKKELSNLLQRSLSERQILNTEELATIWHLPSEKIKVPSILWGTSVLSEAPENLPVAQNASDQEKLKINFFAKTMYKNSEQIFGIRETDRRRHVWVVGKTGTGKSTLIQNMAIDDFKKSRGIGIIDPHGDTCEMILDYIPSHRINDTVYFNPADRDYPISINPLEVTNREEAELVVSGLMSIFTKVWANVWSARMEYILRNSFLTLSHVENTTLADVLKLLSDKGYRDKILEKVNDASLIHFWKMEFDRMPENLQKEAIAPIQNKVGQFVTSPLIRRIIGNPKSTIQIDEIINSGKIFMANLSQGRLGEDNSSLLGAMLITKFQLASMRRVDTPEEKRRDFYLYVDEFQNFATDSFIKILSEARKYRLNLMLANQYMAQIPESVQKAILGNVGTIISFSVGAEDAGIIHKEFAEVFSENDLVNLSNFQIAIKLMVNGESAMPFLANTLPLPISRNNNREKVLRVSRERWGKKS